MARDVQGELFVKNDQGLVLVWGTHSDRGYAAGYLLGDEAVKLFRAYGAGATRRGCHVSYCGIKGIPTTQLGLFPVPIPVPEGSARDLRTLTISLIPRGLFTSRRCRREREGVRARLRALAPDVPPDLSGYPCCGIVTISLMSERTGTPLRYAMR